MPRKKDQRNPPEKIRKLRTPRWKRIAREVIMHGKDPAEVAARYGTNVTGVQRHISRYKREQDKMGRAFQP